MLILILNIFVKLVDTTVETDDALSFLAFTTQIRLDGFNTIEDYCYTDENGLEILDSKDHYDTWITKYNFTYPSAQRNSKQRKLFFNRFIKES